MINDGLARCDHGYLAAHRTEDGCVVPYGGDDCAACKGKQIRLAYKVGGPTPPKKPAPVPIPEVVCLKVDGCVLLVGAGPHTGACLDGEGTHLVDCGEDERAMASLW